MTSLELPATTRASRPSPTPTSTMSTLSAQVAELEAERDELRVRLELVAAREQDIAQRMYRWGYRAGHAAKRRGQPPVTNPERRARGEARRLLA